MKDLRKIFYSNFFREGDLVFDIGANIGNRTEIFSMIGARVVAVEPQSKCVKKLKKMFRNNPNVTVEKLAIGAEKGVAELSISEELDIFSTMSERWKSEEGFGKYTEWNSKELVTVDTVDSLIKKHGIPQFCKIDVEGYEKYVLEGLSHKIPYISFEFTFAFFDDAEKCIEMLTKLGKTEYNVSFGESMSLLSDKWLNREDLTRYIKNNAVAWGDIYVHTI